MGGGEEESERTSEGREEDCVETTGGRSVLSVDGSVREGGEQQTEILSHVFHSVTTNPRRALSAPLSSIKTYIYSSQIRTELKANLPWEVIFRGVFDLQDLPPARIGLLIPREE